MEYYCSFCCFFRQTPYRHWAAVWHSGLGHQLHTHIGTYDITVFWINYGINAHLDTFSRSLAFQSSKGHCGMPSALSQSSPRSLGLPGDSKWCSAPYKNALHLNTSSFTNPLPIMMEPVTVRKVAEHRELGRTYIVSCIPSASSVL